MLSVTAFTARADDNAGSDPYAKVIENAVLEFDAGNWAEARVLFEQAHALRPGARTLRAMGKVSFELKQYVRAQRELSAALLELRAPLSQAQRQEVVGLLGRADRFIGRLEVHVRPEGLSPQITLDGSHAQGELKLDLGQHELSVQAPGYRPLTRTVSVEGGKTLRLELMLTPLDSGAAARSSEPVSAPDLSPTAAVASSPSLTTSDATSPAIPPVMPQRRRTLLRTWWFWTIVGAVAVGGAAAVLVLAAPKGPEPVLQGNTGVTFEALTLTR